MLLIRSTSSRTILYASRGIYPEAPVADKRSSGELTDVECDEGTLEWSRLTCQGENRSVIQLYATTVPRLHVGVK